MADFNPQPLSLEDRRPRLLRQVVGNQSAKVRLVQEMRNGSVPQLAFIYGPTGAGKTTLAHILARYFFCTGCRDQGDPCGFCDKCKRHVEEISNFQEWPGADLERDWTPWWTGHRSELRRRSYFLFVDEAQDLNTLHQKSFLRLLETATATIVFATTHRNAIDNALVNRFGTNVYEMRRPSVAEVVDHLDELCVALDLKCGRDQLRRVAEHYGCDLRKCVDFPFTAIRQMSDKVVTEDYLTAVLGIAPTTKGQALVNRKRRVKL